MGPRRPGGSSMSPQPAESTGQEIAVRPEALAPARQWDFAAPPDLRVAHEVIEQLAFGRTLAEIERDPSFPPRNLFMSWVMRDPALAYAYKRAHEISSFMLEEDALQLLRDLVANPGSPIRVAAVDKLTNHLRWMAGKRNPAVYSEKASVNVTVPIQINTSLDLGKGGSDETAPGFPNIYELKAEVVKEVDLPAPEEETRAHARKARGEPKGRKRKLTPRSAALRPAETQVEYEARIRAEALARKTRDELRARRLARGRELERARRARLKAAQGGRNTDTDTESVA